MKRKEELPEEKSIAGNRYRYKTVFFVLLFLLVGNLKIDDCGSVVKAGNEKNVKSRTEMINELRNWSDIIVYIESVCWDGEGRIYEKKGFTGVVFCADASGTFLLTSDEDLTYSKEELDYIRKRYGVAEDDYLYQKLEVIWDGDLRNEASVVGESTQRNVAILKMAQNVSFSHVPEFASQNVEEKDTVWLLKYPKDLNTQERIHSDDVMISQAKVTKCYELSENQYCNLDLSVEEGSSGGPVFNSDGYLCGLYIKTDGEYRTISSDSLCDLLDSYNVTYRKAAELEKGKVITKKHLVLGVIILILTIIYLIRLYGEKKGGAVHKEKIPSTSSLIKTQASLEYPKENKISNIVQKKCVIGRGEQADFRLLKELSVSRMHAEIQNNEGEYYLSDLNSTNGTYLNGERIVAGASVKLTHGDVIKVGDEVLIFNRIK